LQSFLEFEHDVFRYRCSLWNLVQHLGLDDGNFDALSSYHVLGWRVGIRIRC
jgi:hypothetical protein